MNDLFPETPATILSHHSTADAVDSFEEFWGRYPRKVGKGQARKAYAKALKLDTHENIMFGLSQQIPAMEATDKKFIPHPSTWLNGERWNDEPEEPTGPAPGNSTGNTGVDQIAIAARGRRTPSADCF